MTDRRAPRRPESVRRRCTSDSAQNDTARESPVFAADRTARACLYRSNDVTLEQFNKRARIVSRLRCVRGVGAAVSAASKDSRRRYPFDLAQGRRLPLELVTRQRLPTSDL